MESTPDDKQTDSGTSESQETTARVKIRDLRPEKDPMGAGSKSALPALAQNRWPSAD